MQIDIFINMFGEFFSPGKLGQMTGYPVEDAVEPGTVGKIGKYRGEPTPYGAGEWRFSTGKDVPYGPVFELAVQRLECHVNAIRHCGAEDIVLHFQVYYENQCNLEFSPSQLSRIATLSVSFTVSCEQIAHGEEDASDVT
jgi:hypothetical protein